MNPYAPPSARAPAATASGVPVPVKGLEGRILLRGRNFFSRPGFIVDGSLRRSVRGLVEVTDETGRVHKLRLRGFPLDPYPRVEADGAIIDVFPKLPGWATAICSVPLLLIVAGGAIGGVLGTFATYGNFRIARIGAPVIVRLALGAIVTVSAYASMLAVSALLQLLRH